MRTAKLVTLVLWLVVGVGAASTEEMSYGEAEFLNSRAVYHGDELTRPPAHLIRISQCNGGTFPYARVFAVIDGRYVVPGHGEREMPAWGRQFLVDDSDLYEAAGGKIVMTERIHDLTGHVQSLQRR